LTNLDATVYYKLFLSLHCVYKYIVLLYIPLIEMCGYDWFKSRHVVYANMGYWPVHRYTSITWSRYWLIELLTG